MGLWSMASLYTDLPNWKTCRGAHCNGPCPTHDPLGYNGVDALSCDLALPALKAEMKRKQIPESIYEMRKKLTVLCDLMEKKGIRVDRVLIAKLEKEFNEKKNAIFQQKEVLHLFSLARIFANKRCCEALLSLLGEPNTTDLTAYANHVEGTKSSIILAAKEDLGIEAIAADDPVQSESDPAVE